VFQLPHFLQKLATSLVSPQGHLAGWNRLIETTFLQLRHDQRNTGIRIQTKTRPIDAAEDIAPTAIKTSGVVMIGHLDHLRSMDTRVLLAACQAPSQRAAMKP
jgi:hypothetical protein